MGVQLGSMSLNAAGLVRFWLRRAGLSRPVFRRRPRTTAIDVSRLAILSHAPVKHGYGALEDQRSNCVPLCQSGNGRTLARSDLPAFGCGACTLDRNAVAYHWTNETARRQSPPRSIRNRFPYLDPLNHVQVELLKRHRANKADEQILRGIQLTINGISAGLRNSG